LTVSIFIKNPVSLSETSNTGCALAVLTSVHISRNDIEHMTHQKALEALEKIEDYFKRRADAQVGPAGSYLGNEEMQLLAMAEELRAYLKN
jgi:hypothetical protein